MPGKAADVQFINDQSANREVERPVVFPVEVILRNAPAMRKDVLFPRRAEDRTPADRAGKGIEQDVPPIEAMTGARMERSLHPVAVFDSIRIEVEDCHGEDVTHPEFRREGDFRERARSLLLEKDQSAGCGLRGENRKVDPARNKTGSER